MIDYDTLYFVLQHYRAVCDAVWTTADPMLMWSLLFMGDWIRDLIPNAEFLQMMTLMGEDYTAMAQCMINERA